MRFAQNLVRQHKILAECTRLATEAKTTPSAFSLQGVKLDVDQKDVVYNIFKDFVTHPPFLRLSETNSEDFLVRRRYSYYSKKKLTNQFFLVAGNSSTVHETGRTSPESCLCYFCCSCN
jgi:hypothetical protein